MPIETEEIQCNFVGSFKVGDNLVYNARLLSNLANANEGGIFNKPIVLQVGSILEVALEQIIYRAQNYNIEGVPKISKADQQEITNKKIEKFCIIIDIMCKYKVLDDLGKEVYDELHRIRQYRNKIHIQDNIKIEGVSQDESVAFTDDICNWALALNLRVIRYISENLYRPQHIEGHVNSLTLPSM